MRLETKVSCPDCSVDYPGLCYLGDGLLGAMISCPTCNGTGWVKSLVLSCILAPTFKPVRRWLPLFASTLEGATL